MQKPKAQSLVITSIAADTNKVLQKYAEECKKRDINFIIIGDKKSPSQFKIEGADFWDVKRQASLEFKLAEICPFGHYARKNLGYLLAIREGSTTIIETDDDNLPKKNFWLAPERTQKAIAMTKKGWVNVYRYFSGKTIIWPRGFPLDLITTETPSIDKLSPTSVDCPIQQGLADDNPDIDAIFRLTRELPHFFEDGKKIALGEFSWCPFNSQNTTWFKEAFPLLYLPAYCSFRMTDIWRSFIAQRIAWANGWSILFDKATVVQDRNEHNLMRDFADEVPGYLNNRKICDALQALDLKKGNDSISANLIKCYEEMIRIGVIPQEELRLLHAWISDIENIALKKVAA